MIGKSETLSSNLIKLGGVYLITGGMGGVGRQFARFFASEYQASVILVGRSEENEKSKAFIEELKTLGGQGHYFQANICERSQVRTLLVSIGQELGPLNGIIHAAGVNRDALLEKKSRREMQTVLEPKVIGTLNLDEESAEYPLDFFVMFSSIASMLGNVGQADYAYANAFLDHFAQARETLRADNQRFGKTLTINWPFWRDGGMDLDEQSESYMREIMGLSPLKTASGLRAFVQGLESRHSQLLVVEGKEEKLRKTLGMKSTEAEPSASTTSVAQGDLKLLKKVAERELLTLFSRELKLAKSRIHASEPFERFGVDSIAVVNLNMALQKSFGEISRTLLFEYQTLEELADYFAQEHTESISQYATAEERAALAASTSNTEDSGNNSTLEVDTAVEKKIDGDMSEAIAIIGIAGKYPEAENLWELWENLTQGRDSVSEIPLGRWEHHAYFDEKTEKPGSSYTKWGAFLQDVECFDPLFFRISAREAEGMDPQERLFLETTWALFEDAGYTRETLAPYAEDTAVYVGSMYAQYGWFGLEASLRGEHSLAHSAYWSIANRISYFFNFQGPSMAIDSACSSSLTAIHQACQALRCGEAKMAVAGGVNLSLHPHKYAQMSQGGYASRTGLCRSFGEGGDGYVAGEGCGAVLLKPLSQAIADGDRVHALIRGSALNHGGKTNGFTVPNPRAQSSVIAKAIERADVPADHISYVEAHGTGTSLGDPIEFKGLEKAFKSTSQKTTGNGSQRKISLGSIKSNIGHLEAAAGIAGLSKIVLQMRHRTLTPSLHSDPLNPNIDFSHSNFAVQRDREEWILPTGTDTRIAALSSFGAGGSNAHLIIEEYTGGTSEIDGNNGPLLFPLSARSGEQLRIMAARLCQYMIEWWPKEYGCLEDVAYTLQTGREAWEERAIILAGDAETLIDGLTNILENKPTSNAFLGSVDLANGESSSADTELQPSAIDTSSLSDSAKAWTQGKAIDWQALGNASQGRTISLPSYPFAREPYWPSQPATTAGLVGIHPILGRLIAQESTSRGLVFVQSMNADHWLVDQHRVQGQAMLPGVAYLEMALAAGKQCGIDNDCVIEKLVWSQPFVIGEDETKELRLHLIADEKQAGKLNFRVESCLHVSENPDEGAATTKQWQLHAQGCLLNKAANKETTPIKPSSIDLSLAETVPVMDREEHYALFEQVQINYGEAFQTVNRWWTADNENGAREVLAELEISPAHRSALALGRWSLPPGLLDGALQSLAGMIDPPGQTTFLPFALDKLSIWDNIPNKLYAQVSLSGPQRYRIRLADATGAVCVELEDIAVREYHEQNTSLVSGAQLNTFEAAVTSTPSPEHQMLYAPHWHKSAAQAWSTAWEDTHEPQVGIICHNTSGLETELQRVHKEQGVAILRLINGGQSNITGDGYQIGENLQDEQYWENQSVTQLEKWLRQHQKFKRIYFFAPLPSSPIDQNTVREDFTSIEKDQEYGVLALFRLLKGLSNAECTKEGLELRIITAGAQAVWTDSAVRPGAASVLGLSKVIGKEYPSLHVNAVDIDPNAVFESNLEHLVNDLIIEPPHGRGQDIALRDGRRYKRELWPVQSLAQAPLPIKQGGTYLLAGGAGGIGLELAAHLSRTYQARIILLGRRAEDKVDGLKVLKQEGAKVHYVQADITSPEQVREGLRVVRQKTGPIHGVFHMALVLNDRSLEGMDEDIMRSSLEPKVQGTVCVQESLQDEKLDFVVMFSSAQSYWANAGQANYAAGCSFQDAYGHYLTRHGQRVRIMNWGFWGSVGVVATNDYRERLAKQGILPIEVNEGITALEQALSGSATQLLAFKGTRPAMEQLGVDFGQALEIGLSQEAFHPLVHKALNEEVRTWHRQEGDILEGLEELYHQVEDWARNLLASSLRSMGILGQPGARWHEEDKANAHGIVSEHRQLWQALLQMLARGGWIRVENGTVVELPRSGEELDKVALESKKSQILDNKGELKALITLVETCIKDYPALLKGQLDPISVLFPKASMTLVEAVYKGNRIADYYNGLVVSAVKAKAQSARQQNPNAPLRILEIGSGTGGSSEAVLKVLSEIGGNLQYYYTDISLGFIEYGKREYGSKYDFLTAQILNIENDPVSQGIENGSIDIVLATNVLHATRNMQETLTNIQAMLVGGGMVIVNEITTNRDFSTLTFGLTDGWWRFDDAQDRMDASPLSNQTQWLSLLKETGFYQAQTLIADPKEAALQKHQGQAVVVGWNGAQVFHSTLEDKRDNEQQEKTEAALTKTNTQKPVSVNETHGGITSDALEKETIKYITEVFSSVLKIESSRFKSNTTFEMYGVDSLTTMEIIKKFETDIGSQPATLLFEYMTMDKLSHYFLEEHKDALISLFGIEEVSAKEEVQIEDDQQTATISATLIAESDTKISHDRSVEILLSSITDSTDPYGMIEDFVEDMSAEEIERLLKSLDKSSSEQAIS